MSDNVQQKFSMPDNVQQNIKILYACRTNFGAVGDGSDKGNLGKVGKISNFGAVGDGSDKG